MTSTHHPVRIGRGVAVHAASNGMNFPICGASINNVRAIPHAADGEAVDCKRCLATLAKQPAPAATEMRYVKSLSGDAGIDARNRSYPVRARIAEIIGAPAHHDFHTEVLVKFSHPRLGDWTGTLTSTSNAGFNGIEGSVRVGGGRKVISLGYITHVQNAGQWEVLS